ncbi:Peptidyl-prolyl cis-trans isomerase A precursor [Planctomycetes bacterium MalM25]|nr:Peptidyl-prolyl cis-trans isomerase A precursor [Planctomycetes bacterium MalM25]
MMTRAALLALAAILAGSATQATAQTVRFQTSVGAFDMLLNPTRNADLQPLVDNMLANVASGIYKDNVVNRAQEGFVLQLGSFDIDPADIGNISADVFQQNETFDPVIVDTNGDLTPDLDLGDLSNVRGTVSLALAAGDPNSGRASFFVNIGDNSASLDPQGFVPFAAIVDMTPIDELMALEQVNLGGNLALSDVPLDENGDFVIVETASVISESNFSFIGPVRTALGIEPTVASVSASGSSVGAISPAMAPSISESIEPAAASALAVPEPGAAALVLSGLALLARRR